ncbi:uncharacterized protein EI90DRAFT_332284 [Cantharellus anzutake]|uniref:uncharacterized protein n=1 Tax=Cantharellus anzutake TaxID=1750568 RepID=UPI0019076794|nr:uncharacterized protein EI90DRAFT_332284 [Cantharellus anzutake]KAF8335466.1 hypothetical protein EI90DRAFT_332284 [Cantharellus anzutake]
MDRRKRRHSTYEPEPHPPKRHSPMAPDDNQQQPSAPSSSLDPSQYHPANSQTRQTGDNSLHDWHNGAYVVAHGTTTTSSDSYPLSSVMTLPGPSYSHPPSHQVLHTDPQALQGRDVPRDWCSGSVGPYPGVPGPAPAFGPSGDPRKFWMPWPKRVTELPVSDSQSHTLVSSLQNHATSSQTLSEIHRDWHDGLSGSYLQHPQIAPPRSPSDDFPSFRLPRIEVTSWHSNPNSGSRSGTPVPVPSPSTPSSPAHSDRFLSPPSALSPSETACASPNPWAPYDNSAGVRTELENAGMNLPVPASEPTPSSSAGPSDGKKESIISTTRLILQTASSALKFSPVPFLPNIPDSLLMLLQVYEVRIWFSQFIPHIYFTHVECQRQ